MLEILKTEQDVLVKIFQNRQKESDTLWEDVENSYKKNIKVWQNKPDWLSQVPTKRSKIRDNRVFMATESQLNKVTARPAKPMILPANETEEAKEIATNLQVKFLEDYKQRDVKKTLKRGLRYLHFSKLICLKVFWDEEIDDYNVRAVDPRKVRFSTNATKEPDSEFSIEEIDDKKLMDLIYRFPEKEEEILKLEGKTKEEAQIQNPKVKYHEFWIGDGVCWIYKNKILKARLNPYWDFEGLLLTPQEIAEIEQTQDASNGESIPVLNGRRRRQTFRKFKGEQETRRAEVEENPEAAGKYEQYLYNHHDKPRKPYIYGTILEVEDKPIGETTLIEQVSPLQEGVDKRKRQIDDNSDMVNGVTKVDTELVEMTLADARSMHYDPQGLIYGDGVSNGVKRESGESLPEMVFKDLQDSRNEIDEIFGTTATFRGSGSDNEKTATGRAILREESLSRLDEIVSLVDYIGGELYNWWLQMIKVKYTESHLVKTLGNDRATKTIELMQDDIQEGLEIKIQPGQTLPDDRLFRAERAREDLETGIVDPITYLEAAGGYDNPEAVLKKAVLFKANPFTMVNLDGEDMERIEEAKRIMEMVRPQQAGPEAGNEGGEENPEAIAQLRQRVEEITSSESFKALPPEEQESTLQEIRGQFEKLGVDFTREPTTV